MGLFDALGGILGGIGGGISGGLGALGNMFKPNMGGGGGMPGGGGSQIPQIMPQPQRMPMQGASQMPNIMGGGNPMQQRPMMQAPQMQRPIMPQQQGTGGMQAGNPFNGLAQMMAKPMQKITNGLANKFSGGIMGNNPSVNSPVTTSMDTSQSLVAPMKNTSYDFDSVMQKYLDTKPMRAEPPNKEFTNIPNNWANKLPKGANLEMVNNLLDPELLSKYGISSQQAVRNVMSQAAHETGGFTSSSERGGMSYFNKYEPGTTQGKKLGNIEKGDGYAFRGRGPVQLTGRWNYDHYGKMIGQDLVNNPDLAADPKVGAELTLAYFKDRIGGVMDSNNITAVTKRINPGLKGLSDRKKWYNIFSSEE